ncbi:MAG: 16S rRNA (uracil(1498)-N(3))-methyltransferase [Oscillospiraceae bacterium]|nr:16S rRNA (uracil(1498)-N(3))-methyltransferase [Oscillospiraceae bacterium]
MPKFFVPECDLSAGTVTLTGSNAEHLKVLRVRIGEEILLCDTRGRDARCAVELLGGSVRLRVLETLPSRGEPTVSAVVYASLPKGDKAETIVQKAVELGAEGICFFLTDRCVSRPDAKSTRGKMERLNKIAEAAAMQSFRGRIPEVRWLPDLASVLADACEREVRAFLWEGERDASLRSALQQRALFRSAALISGPEGGFSPEEAAQAEAAGFAAVTLGERILRCETAPLAALAAVMYESGNLG